MNDEVALIEGGGNRVDQEGHVVVDDLDDRVVGLPPVLLAARVVDAHLGLAGGALGAKRPVGQRRAQEVCGILPDDVLGRHVFVVMADEALERQSLVLAEPRARPPADLVHKGSLLPIKYGRHGLASQISRPARRHASEIIPEYQEFECSANRAGAAPLSPAEAPVTMAAPPSRAPERRGERGDRLLEHRE